jgi:UDPglucose 6-dehydrogenase
LFPERRGGALTLRGKRIAALWLECKTDTDYVRESPALDIIRKLLSGGAKVTPFDSAATERGKEFLPPSTNRSYAEDLYEAARGADAVVILTEWKEFAAIDFGRLREVLRFPIVVDGRNLFTP